MTSPRGRIDRLILETLDSVVAPSVRDALLTLALEDAGLAELPVDDAGLLHFVEGPLRAAMVHGLGTELAESVLEEIARTAQLLGIELGKQPRRHTRPGMQRSLSPPPRRNTPSHRPAYQTPPTLSPPAPELTREAQDRIPTLAPPPMSRPASGRALSAPPRSGPVSRPGAPWGSNEYPSGTATLGLEPGSGPVSRPYVLVATEDARLLEQLVPWLDSRAELAQVISVRELVADLELMAESRIALVVDCRRPSVRPIAIAALAEELPSTVSVVLWAPTPEQERALREISPLVESWSVVRGEAPPDALAERCAALVG